MSENETPTIQSSDALNIRIVLIAEGDRYDAATGVVTGTSKYILIIPKIGRMVGFTIRIIAAPNHPVRFETHMTSVEKSSEEVMRQLYRHD